MSAQGRVRVHASIKPQREMGRKAQKRWMDSGEDEGTTVKGQSPAPVPIRERRRVRFRNFPISRRAIIPARAAPAQRARGNHYRRHVSPAIVISLL